LLQHDHTLNYSKSSLFVCISLLPVLIQRIRDLGQPRLISDLFQHDTRNTRTCPAVVPHCGTKAEVIVPSLDDWEKEWGRNPQRSVQSKLLPVGFLAQAMKDFKAGLTHQICRAETSRRASRKSIFQWQPT